MRLYLVPSPIGNLGDITYRAVEVLKNADVILCEDTRTSSVLLKHYGIQKPLTPYHQHNEHKVLAHLFRTDTIRKNFALITDAGTPGISDPGFFACSRMCQEQYSCRMPSRSYSFCAGAMQSAYSQQVVFNACHKGKQTYSI